MLCAGCATPVLCMSGPTFCPRQSKLVHGDGRTHARHQRAWRDPRHLGAAATHDMARGMRRTTWHVACNVLHGIATHDRSARHCSTRFFRSDTISSSSKSMLSHRLLLVLQREAIKATPQLYAATAFTTLQHSSLCCNRVPQHRVAHSVVPQHGMLQRESIACSLPS